jgi:predicted amidohydrolase YtcJ
LRDINGHEAWVNSLALAHAGITAATPDPPAGEIKRDDDGRPSGHLLEDAVKLVAKVLPSVSEDLRDRGLQFALRRLITNGITSVHDASVSPAVLATYVRAFEAGQLPIPVHMALQWKSEMSLSDNLEHLCQQRRLIRQLNTPMLSAETVKIFVDGLPENCTAAMHQPYARAPPTHSSPWSGVLNYSPALLACIVAALAEAGFQIHFHCLGDLAVTVALDALALLPCHLRQRGRHIIAHIQFIDPADLPRFRELGVLANLSPYWFQQRGSELAALHVGLPRALNQYPARSLHKHGALCGFGSDWPVSSPIPLEGIQVAVTRRPLARSTPTPTPGLDHEWNYWESLSLDQAVWSYTTGSALINFCEHQVGKLRPSYLADFLVLNRDLFSEPHDRIARLQILRTYRRGHLLFQADQESAPL